MWTEKGTQKPAVFYIPLNYNAAGTCLNGMLKTRNALEALILSASICIPLYKIAGLPLMTKVILTVVVVFPLAAVALIGVNDGSLFQYAADVFHYLASGKNILFYSVYARDQLRKLKSERRKWNDIFGKRKEAG